MKIQFSLFNLQPSIRPSAGFTLIEVILVIAIIVIITTSTFAVSNTYIQTQKLNTAVDNLKNSLNEAKSSALSQTVVTTGAGSCGATGMTLVGYQLWFIDQHRYHFKEVCKNSSGSWTSSTIRVITLPPGVSNNMSGDGIQFYIKSEGGGTTSSSDRNIVLSLGGRTRTVIVTKEGLIK